MDMQILATVMVVTHGWYVNVSTIHAVQNVILVALVSNKKRGGNQRHINHLFVNVRIFITLILIFTLNTLFLACNCFSHSNECIYDEEVDKKGLSLDIHGKYEGGGVCQNCRHNTEGINCNKCKPRFYRPHGKLLNETDVCHRKFNLFITISVIKTLKKY